MAQQSVMSRSWEIARKSAKRWGGTAAEYHTEALRIAAKEQKGLVSKIENTWKMQDTRWERVKKTRTVLTKTWQPIDATRLPIIPYFYELKGTDWVAWGGTTKDWKHASGSFWMNNRGNGSAPGLTDDDIDMSNYQYFEPGVDATPEEFIEEFWNYTVENADTKNAMKYEKEDGQNGTIYEEAETEEQQDYYVTEPVTTSREYYGWKEEDG